LKTQLTNRQRLGKTWLDLRKIKDSILLMLKDTLYFSGGHFDALEGKAEHLLSPVYCCAAVNICGH
jgi:hypothetical protein